ncbi:MAG: outer membrane lipid asymmetry maintenance protein MlaD [Alphaproteobacteria bacterium]|jgi:phospholipid/cholesterol/gamma-HCH transport system substrate-binding protein|nr:outer membrane lipid asymmetry maintenance protein MlaD [Alphaproteobacteria bacterium]
MGGTLLETLLGAGVVIVAAAFLVFAFGVSDVGAVKGYELIAKFDRVDGLAVGSDVKVGGIKVGTVMTQELDPATYLAVVYMSIDDGIPVPVDSSAEIVSEGLLGGRYMAIVPGPSDEMLKAGGLIRFTQSSISIEQLLGQFAFGGGDP